MAKAILEEASRRLSAEPSTISVTFVGSLLESKRTITEVADIDVVVVVRRIDHAVFEHLTRSLETMEPADFGLPGYQFIVNSTFGPLKFNRAGVIVFHLMVYDLVGHRNHAIQSPFTCYDWERSPASYGPNLKQIYGAGPLRLSQLIKSRRSIESYLSDLRSATITYRQYEFDDAGYREVVKKAPVDERHRFEYALHVLRNLGSNLVKILDGANGLISNQQVADRLLALHPGLKGFGSLLLDLDSWKHRSVEAVPNLEHRLSESLQSFGNAIEWVSTEAPQVTFLRHARTPLNDGRFLGQASNPDLAEPPAPLGREVRFDAVFSSPLRRAVRTARCLVPGASVQEDHRLAEIDYGECEGLVLADLPVRFPEIIAGWAGGVDPRFPGGESQSDVLLRLRGFIQDLVSGTAPRSQLLVVTHYVVMRCLLGGLLELPVSAWYRIPIGHLDSFRFLIIGGRLVPDFTETQSVALRDSVYESTR